MKKFNRINTLMGWASFAIALMVYILTLEPSVSLWDCGEFISASYLLQIVHPPGAPLFLMLGKLFTLFSAPYSNEVAIGVNMLSATASAATVMLTFWITVHFAKKILKVGLNDAEVELGKAISILGSGLVAALTVTFMDSFWFSAVEAEVYASSSAFMALAFWAILRWERIQEQPTADRWLVFVAYVIGLGIGLHLLNILVVPAIVYYYFFNKYEINRANFLKASLIGFGTIAILQWGIIPKTPVVAAMFDKLFVNSFGLPFNSGIVFFMFLVAILVGYGLWWTRKKGRPIANLILLCFAFIMLGFSSYSMIVIRSLADPAIDMNDPEDAYSLKGYIQREQYGDRPLVYGQYWNARLYQLEEGAMQYRKGEDGYEETKPKQVPVYEPSYMTWFPRMSDPSEKSRLYPLWAGMDNVHRGIEATKRQLQGNVTAEQRKELEIKLERLERTKPTMAQNLTFMFRYQIGWMYWRYFMWNFVGRQNDLQNQDGNLRDGNWISGIDFVDNMRLGPQKDRPSVINYHKGRNTYYFLPLILGLLGIWVQYKKRQHDFFAVLVMFIFTGILVVIYLNQPPMEPRERDYTNVGSYQTFAIWVGLGVLFLGQQLRRFMNIRVAATTATLVGLVAAPYLLGSQNWDDHDRSDRYLGISFAKNYLESCKPNAILFTNGDNDTYPLWYAQNVEKVRRDIRIINLSLLPTEWYSDALRRKVFDSEPLPMSIPEEKFNKGKREYVRFTGDNQFDQEQFYGVRDVLDFMTNDDPRYKKMNNIGEVDNYMPVKRFRLNIDKESVLSGGNIPLKDSAQIVDQMRWRITQGGLSKGDLVVLDIVETNARTGWKRPIYWTTTIGSSAYLNMDGFLRNNGLVYELLPIQANRRMAGLDDMDLIYHNLMDVFEWGNMEKGTMFLDDKATLVPQNMRRLFHYAAAYFADQGQKDSARALIDECYAKIPESILPMPLEWKMDAVDVYYAIGDTAKAEEFLKKVGDDAEEAALYYKRFPRRGKKAQMRNESDYYISILAQVYQVFARNGNEELATQYENKYNIASNAL